MQNIKKALVAGAGLASSLAAGSGLGADRCLVGVGWVGLGADGAHVSTVLLV